MSLTDIQFVVPVNFLALLYYGNNFHPFREFSADFYSSVVDQLQLVACGWCFFTSVFMDGEKEIQVGVRSDNRV